MKKTVYGLLIMYPNFTVNEAILFDSVDSRDFHIDSKNPPSYRTFEYEIEDVYYF